MNESEMGDLEERVKREFERRAPLRLDEKVIVAWDLSQELKKHHPPSYVDSLNVTLKTVEVLRATPFPVRPGLFGALNHDHGKVEIPVKILDKTYGIGGEYTLEDHEIMKRHSLIGYERLKEHGLLMSAFIAAFIHTFNLKDPYPSPNELPPYPTNFSNGTILNILFNSRIVSLADQYIAFHRPNKMHGDKPLTSEEIKRFMMGKNPDQEELISNLYSDKYRIFT